MDTHRDKDRPRRSPPVMKTEQGGGRARRMTVLTSGNDHLHQVAQGGRTRPS